MLWVRLCGETTVIEMKTKSGATVADSGDPFFLGMAGDPLAAVAVINGEGRMVFCNPQWDRFQMESHGARFETLQGRLIDEVFPPEQAAEHRELALATAACGRAQLVRKCCAGRMFAVWTCPIMPPTRYSATEPVFLFVVRAEIIDEHLLSVTGDGTIPVVEFRHSDLGPLSVLSRCELQVLALIARGMSTKRIAETLGRSVKTVESHRTSIGNKLKVDDRVQLAELARRAGLTTREISDSSVDGSPHQ